MEDRGVVIGKGAVRVGQWAEALTCGAESAVAPVR